ncbi:zinc finger protein 37 homolog [Scomber scombrus]|uniref:Zinc finger protein 37 homolog n=1 Tax=Scomber scombrus TaxID=13677 RepID=A0AAV1NJS5_SCOSC
MSSAQYLREFINERLTAAAEEIFRVFHKTVVEYEEEIDRQRRLLDTAWKPEITLNRIELPQQHVCKEEKEEDVLTDQQLCDQETNSSLDQVDPEPPQIKEEQDELCVSLEGEQLVLKQETETFISTATYEENEYQTQDFSLDETQSALEDEHVFSIPVKSSEVPELNNDDQLLSHNSHVAESQDHKGGKQGDSGSTRNTETKAQKRHCESESHTDNEDTSTMLKTNNNTQESSHSSEKSFRCETCGNQFKHMFNLRRHLTLHKGDGPKNCGICGRDFRFNSGLMAHMRIHTSEKHFFCITCGKRFSQRSNLKNHMRTHIVDETNSRETCGKTFDLSLIERHMKTHRGQGLFRCNTCGKRFTQKLNLTRHINMYHGGEKLNCSMKDSG